jgi:uncharacterized protein (TIGR02265 family)
MAGRVSCGESVPIDRADLQRRIAASTIEDTVRGLIFNAGFAVIRDQLGDAAARRCDPVGTATRTEFFSYPVADYLRMAFAAAEELETRMGGPDAVFHAIGTRAIQLVLGSMLGRTLVSLAGSEPKRLLSQIHPGYRATVSYGERSIEWTGEKQGRAAFRRDFLVPPFHAGVLSGALVGMGCADVRVKGRQIGFLDMEFDISWS